MGAVGRLRLREKLSVKVVAFFPTNQERRVPERGAAERSIDQGLQEKMNGYLQGLSNACDRLNSVQREEEGI